MNKPERRSNLLVVWSVAAGILLVTSGACAADPATETWTPYVSEDGLMAAEFPAKPTITDQSVKSPLGELKFRVIAHNSPEGAFQISRIKYPVSPKDYDVKTGLTGAVNGAVAKTNGKLVSVKDIEKFHLPGKDCVIEADGGRVIFRSRILIDGNGPTLYFAQVVGTKEFNDSAQASKFLDSLRIKPIAKQEN